MGKILIKSSDLIKGESSADWVSDRGFSPDSYGLNLLAKRGALNFIEAGTDRGSGVLTGAPVGYTNDKNLLGNDKYIVDDGGAFYTLDGSTLTKRQTSTADTFQLGTTDMLQFLGSTYATGQQRIAKLDNSDLTTIDSGWWTGLTNGYRHPLEVVEGKMYIGDQNLVHTWDGTTSTASAIVLPTDVNITSLRKHPNGRDLIAFCGLTANFSHTLSATGRIYIIDTTINDWTREIETEFQVEGSRLVGGVVYVTFGMNVGYFNGDGVTFLKKLRTSGTTYSHSMGNLEDILLVRDGTNCLAYGDLGAGRVWWNLFRNSDGTAVNIVAYKGDNKVLFGTAGGSPKLYEIDYDNVGSANGKFYSNRYFFEDEVMIKKIEVLHDAIQASTRFLFYERDTLDTESTILDSTPGIVGLYKTQTNTAFQRDVFQFVISPTNDDLYYHMVRLHYEPVRS